MAIPNEYLTVKKLKQILSKIENDEALVLLILKHDVFLHI
tara:strand:- start:1780 stop:1899 length:120 start_codon:yes stop_codon:yes gene_type:complete